MICTCIKQRTRLQIMDLCGIMVYLTAVFSIQSYRTEALEESVTAVRGECGRSERDPVNVTYIGEASRVYSVEDEVDCVATRVDEITHRLEKVNQRPNCGVKWDNVSRSYSFSVRVQLLPFLVTAEDKVYNIQCHYDNRMMTNPKAQMTVNENRLDGTKISNDPQTSQKIVRNVFVVRIQDKGNQGLKTITDSTEAKIEVQNSTWTEDEMERMYVEECIIVNTGEIKTISLKVISEGCGTGVFLRDEAYFFRNVTDGSFASPPFRFPVLPVELEQISVKCIVKVMPYPVLLEHLCMDQAANVTQATGLDNSLTGDLGTLLSDSSSENSLKKNMLLDTSRDQHSFTLWVPAFDVPAREESVVSLSGESADLRIDHSMKKYYTILKNTTNDTSPPEETFPRPKCTEDTQKNTIHYILITCILAALLVVFAIISILLARKLLKMRKIGLTGSYSLRNVSIDDQVTNDKCAMEDAFQF